MTPASRSLIISFLTTSSSLGLAAFGVALTILNRPLGESGACTDLDRYQEYHRENIQGLSYIFAACFITTQVLRW